MSESSINEIYRNSGDTKKKNENAAKMHEKTKENDLPKQETFSPWKKPICKVCGDFNTWLDDQNKHTQVIREDGKKTGCFNWYKYPSPISIWDRANYRKQLFNTEEIQADYKRYLGGTEGVSGDPVGIKFQSGNIMADERAFYLRHAPISLSFACGLMSKNKYHFLRDVYINNVEKVRALCDKHWDVCHENRDKE